MLEIKDLSIVKASETNWISKLVNMITAELAKHNTNSKVKRRGENNMNILNKNNDDWTSETELMTNLDISPETIDQIICDFFIRLDSQIINGTMKDDLHNLETMEGGFHNLEFKKGGFHNLETYYSKYLTDVIIKNAKYYTNKDTDAIKKIKAQGALLNTVINSGDLEAAQDLCNLIMEKTTIKAQNLLCNCKS